MANIPVEHKSGLPWWAWLLGLLALLLVGALILSQCNDDDADLVDTTVMDDGVSTAGIVDDLDLSDVYVTRVVGDNTFFVAPTQGGTDETLVYIEEEATPGTPTEGRYDVTEGQHLSITGTMADTPPDLTPWGLTAEQAAMVGDRYVRATSLTVLDGAMGADAGATDAGGTVTSIVDLDRMFDDTAMGDLAGRAVNLSSVRVTSVVGDSTFYVGDGDDRVLVVLEDLGESETGANGTDGVYDVNAGDTVSLRGRVQRFAQGMRGTGELAEPDVAGLATRRYVVVTDRGGFSK